MGDNLTQLMNRARRGDDDANATLFRLIEAQLHQMAAAQMNHERSGHTLQATALVNEAYIRMAGASALRFEDRAHFMRTVSQVMRHLLVDHARARKAHKRGGQARRDNHTPLDQLVDNSTVDLIALNEALVDLERMHPRQSKLVELRFFGGMTAQEAADLLGISKRTADSDWNMARAWLRLQLSDEAVVRDDTSSRTSS